MLQREGEIRIPAGCAISAIMNKNGERFSGEDIIKSISLMHDRSNGLGGGFAAYGIYPDYKEFYAFHIFYDDAEAKKLTEDFINEHYDVEVGERIPTRKTQAITNPPMIWRYFVKPNIGKLIESELTDDEYTARCVINMNTKINGAYVFSSGKNMGAFKAIGFPEDVGEFYMLEHYKGHMWTAHGRFPTNTPGWWGGAHPFTLLDWSIVHNGEISSYDTNRRYVEMYGYKCNLQTDTEVITFLYDFLVRKHGLDLQTASEILTAPNWDKIDNMDEKNKEKYTALRTVYSNALVNGPFSIILGFNEGILALNDRLKLRALIAAEKGDNIYFASEEAAIRIICKDPDKVWAVDGGKPIIVKLKGGVK